MHTLTYTDSAKRLCSHVFSTHRLIGLIMGRAHFFCQVKMSTTRTTLSNRRHFKRSTTTTIPANKPILICLPYTYIHHRRMFYIYRMAMNCNTRIISYFRFNYTF